MTTRRLVNATDGVLDSSVVIAPSTDIAVADGGTGASAAVATIQNDVLAQDRNIVHTSTNNETGSKTIAVGILSDANTATQTFTRTRAELYKGAAI